MANKAPQTQDKAKLNKIRKEIEDFYKSWFKKYFQKGVRDARVYMGPDTIVIIGYEVYSFVELSINDDAYSEQLLRFTREKLTEKNFAVFKNNVELITGRKIEDWYVSFSVDKNSTCLSILMGKELAHEED